MPTWDDGAEDPSFVSGCARLGWARARIWRGWSQARPALKDRRDNIAPLRAPEVPLSATTTTTSKKDEAAARRQRAQDGWAFMRRAMAGHWHVLWSSVFWALMAAGAAASIPILLGDAVDEGLISRHWDQFAVYVALIATLGIVQGLSSGARRWYNGVASRHVESELRRGFHDHLLTLDVAYHSNVNRGQLLSRVTSDLFQIQAVVASAPFWVANAALAVAVAIILLVTSPILGVVAVVALPLVAITSQRFSRRVREAIADLQRKRGPWPAWSKRPSPASGR